MGEHWWYMERNYQWCVFVVCAFLFTEPGGVDSSLLPTWTYSGFGPVLGSAFVLFTHIPPGSKTTVWFTLLHVRAGGRERRRHEHRNKDKTERQGVEGIWTKENQAKTERNCIQKREIGRKGRNRRGQRNQHTFQRYYSYKSLSDFFFIDLVSLW